MNLKGFANATELSNFSGSDDCFVRMEAWIAEYIRDYPACNDDLVEEADAEGLIEWPV